MKKLLAVLLTAVTVIACAFCAAGCNNSDGGKLKVFAPDGAPALSLCALNQTEADGYFDASVVKADTIGSYVSGKMEADIALIPVNAAVKLLGSGENYKMLGTVTHGNLYLLKKQNGADISSVGDLNGLVGKTVGVINLANVPGLTFKVILQDNGVAFNELKDGAAAAQDKVNLKNVTALEVIPTNADCDYFVVPEPAATTKVKATGGKLQISGNLQTLYGGENGYPQAVAVAKTSVISENENAISAFISAFGATKSWLMNESTTSQEILSAVDNMTKGDLSHTFTAANLTKQVIANCGINFESNQTGKAAVLAFMGKLNSVSNDSWGTPSDAFFY